MTERRLYPYQRKAATYLYRRKQAALFAGVGSGKTGILLHLIWRHIMECAVRKVLIVAPVAVAKHVWTNEYLEWEHHLTGLTFSRVVGSAAKRMAAMQADADIYLVNYENIIWLLNHPQIDLSEFDMLVLDESTKIKSASSVRFKGKGRQLNPKYKEELIDYEVLMVEYKLGLVDEKPKKPRKWFPPVKGLKSRLKEFEYRFIMTGTPKPGDYEQLYSQIYMLDMGKRLGHNVTRFRHDYYTQGQSFYQRFLKHGADVKIQEKLKDICYYVPEKEIAKSLPRVKQIDHKVSLPPDIREIYNDLQDEFFALFEESGEIVTVANVAVRSGKLQQCAQGAIYTDDGNVEYLHDEKLEMLDALVDDLNNRPTLVIYSFRHDLDRLRRWRSAPLLKASMPEKKLDKLIHEWNDGKHPIMYGHPDSMGHGLNLQHSSFDVIFFGLTWSLEKYQQTIGRLRRTGQKNKVIFVHRIATRSTIDTQFMLPRLKRRSESQRDFLKSFQRYRNEVYSG